MLRAIITNTHNFQSALYLRMLLWSRDLYLQEIALNGRYCTQTCIKVPELLSFYTIALSSYYLKFLVDTYTCPILGPLVLLFLISSDVSYGFQSQSGFGHIFCGGECNVHFLRSTSGATPADVLAAGIAAGHFPICMSRGGSWLGFEAVT